ncbi:MULTISPECIES: TolC family protein [Nostocales]|uniref:TolC family protein n=3 Tax=Nostocales TaxID=1161 RepID=A0A0C1RJZ1_9CYAN|nr:TolC family protein [Tolypothrix bouteillei]KAF3890342.1 TolC family protein [Tolypothrix bouteillei VB521301]
MKGQIIFYSFLPSVTVAVLSTQTVLADTAEAAGVRHIASPSVFSSIYEDTSATININSRLATAVNNSVATSVMPSTNNAAGIIKSVSDRAGVVVTGKTGVPVRRIAGKIQGVLLEFKPTIKQIALIKKIRSASGTQKQSNPVIIPDQEPQQSTVMAVVQNSNPTGSVLEKTSTPAKQPVTEKKNSGSQLLSKLIETPKTGKVVEVAQMLDLVEFCPQPGKGSVGRSASLLLKSSTCSPNTAAVNRVAQSDSTATPPGESVNVKQDASTTTAPGQAVDVSQDNNPTTPSTPAISISQGFIKVPDYLNPSPNPLQFPTRPEEVRIRGTQPITLNEAIELARRNNRTLQEALLTLERNRFAVREQQAALLPSASLNANITRSGPGFIDREQLSDLQRQLGQQEASSSTSFGAGAQIQYDLYTSGSRRASIRAAEEQLRSAELEVETQSETIRLNVTTQYYDLQQADENVRIAQSAVTNAQASLRDAQALERAGVSTRFDVLRSQVNLANAQQQLTNARSQQRIARRQLAQTLSLAQALDITAADPVKLAGLWNIPLDQTIVQAFQNRPELQQRLADRNAAEQRRRSALAQLGPQFSVVAQYNTADEFDDSQSIQDNYSLALRANLNLYDGGAARARANQERVNIRIAENQFADQRNQIRFEVEQAYSDLQANLENVQTATAAVDQSREALRLARLRFQAGVGTQTEVIDAENDLTRSEGQRVEAILDYNRSLARLQRSITARANR